MSNLVKAAKRRRLNDATSTLSKPFKSPFKANQKTEGEEENIAPIGPPSTEPMKPSGSPPSQSLSSAQHPIHAAYPADSTKTPPSLKYAPRDIRSTSSIFSASNDPEISTLHKQNTHLLTQLSQLRHDLDTTRQALRIESSETDAELEALIVKWRRASRDAAEEVFKGAKDRVNRMGGVAGMREREKWRKEWDRDEEQKEKWDEEGGREDEVDEREIETPREEVVREDEVSSIPDVLLLPCRHTCSATLTAFGAIHADIYDGHDVEEFKY
jgi:Swi5-dependent recombination DNA repair protein 1